MMNENATDDTAVRRMNTAEATVATLIANGIDTVFCLPGVQNDYLFDALHKAQNAIRPVHTRHEQATAYMALGAALATGRPAAYAVVPGPGFLNTTAALSTAYACNAPVLALVGQIAAASIGRGYGQLHEIPDQLAIMRGLTKWADRIRGAAEAPGKVAEAFRQMRSGRPRPVALECAIDVWSKRADVRLPTGPALPEPTPVDTDGVARAAALLGAARAPLIVVGSGAQDASAEVTELSAQLQAPVLANRMGRGVLSSRSPFSVNVHAGHTLWGQADVVLAIGTRLQLPLQAWGTDSEMKIIRIDADPEELDRIAAPAVGIVGDAAPVLRALLDALPARNRARASRVDDVLAVRATSDAVLSALQPQFAYLAAMRAALPEETVIVDELTQLGYGARLAFPVYAPRTFLSPGYQGTLGWGLGAALGAKVARPDVPVVAFSGDGGFMFNVQELASAVQHRIPVIVVLGNDGAYGNVRRIQKQSYGGRLIASELRNPDFVRLAESFGALGLRARSPEELGAALRTALAADVPTVIDVPMGELPDPWDLLRLGRNRGTRG
jgi:acetolactate synthase-1/2/3 large subunit